MREFTTRKYQHRKEWSLTLALEGDSRTALRRTGTPVRSAGDTHRGQPSRTSGAGRTFSTTQTELADWDGQGHVELASCAHTQPTSGQNS